MRKAFIVFLFMVFFAGSANTGIPCSECTSQQVDTSKVIRRAVKDIVTHKTDSVMKIIDSISMVRAEIKNEIDSISKHRRLTVQKEIIRFHDGYYLYSWYFKGENFYKLKISKL